MNAVRPLVLATTLIALSASAAFPNDNHPGKDDLVTLYLLSVAADRCGFAITPRQSDRIEREAQALVEKLKLQPRESTAVYSEADVKFERQGPKACDRNGAFAKGFQQTLQRLTGP